MADYVNYCSDDELNAFLAMADLPIFKQGLNPFEVVAMKGNPKAVERLDLAWLAVCAECLLPEEQVVLKRCDLFLSCHIKVPMPAGQLGNN